MNLLSKLVAKFKRPPDFIIGERTDPYMLRWYIIPRNKYFNVYLHKVLRSDEPIFHDHPWKSYGLILSGSYYENTPGGRVLFEKWKFKYRDAHYLHWLEKNSDEPVWTLFVTTRKIKDWGFLCGDKIINHKEALVTQDENGNAGIRCPD